METLTELFQYNRGNFMFDRKLRQEREYMEQDMRIKQFLLYRQDVRDLTDLTVSKMDTYLMIALLEIGCCLDLLVEGVIRGRVIEGPGGEKHLGEERHCPLPEWILWMYVISLAEAMLYLFLSSWFAIHASVACHSYSVRLLTQYVRLPVPNKAQLDAAAAQAKDYEAQGLTAFARVPVVREVVDREAAEFQEKLRREQQAQAQDALAPRGSGHAGLIGISSAGNCPVTALDHIKAYRELQANWQAHDAYARACLCIGTYAFLHAVAYYTIGLLVVELQAPWAGFATCMTFPALCWLLLRLDLYFSTYAQVIRGAVLVSGPMLAMVCASLQLVESGQHGAQQECHNGQHGVAQHAHFVMVPFIFLQHIFLIINIVFAASAEKPVEGQVRLPTRFRAVLYVDVFGWLDSPAAAAAEDIPTSRFGLGRRRRGTEAGPHIHIRQQGIMQAYRELSMARCELEAWTSYGAELRKMPALLAGIVELQRQSEEIKKMLDGVDTDKTAQKEVSKTPLPENPPIWLRIVYRNDTTGHEVEYYHKPSTGDSQLRMPEDSQWVSDIMTLKELMQSLHERTNAWQPQDRIGIVGSGSSGAGSTLSAAPAASPSARRWAGWSGGRPITPGCSIVGSSDSQISSTLSAAGREEQPVEETNPLGTQEERFGGAEAIPLTRDRVDREYFHPRRDNRHKESTRPQSDIPWLTFAIASLILIVVWALGIGYNVILPIYQVANGRLPNTTVFTEALAHRLAAVPTLLGGERLVVAGDWPPRPVAHRIAGLSCHPALGSTVLVAERFAVYAVQFSGSWEFIAAQQRNGTKVAANVVSISLADDVQACISQRPDFHAGGLAAVTVDCLGADGCSAVLLGAAGGHALRCPLRAAGAAPELVHLAAARGRHARSSDGTWRSLVAATGSADGGSRWWALPSLESGRSYDSLAEAELPEPVALRLQHSAAGRVAAPSRAPRSPTAVAVSAPPDAALRHTARVADADLALGLAVPSLAGRGGLSLDDEPLLLDVAASRRLLRAWRTPSTEESDQGLAVAPAAVGAWRLPSGQAWAAACGSRAQVLAATADGELWAFPGPAAAESNSPDIAAGRVQELPASLAVM